MEIIMPLAMLFLHVIADFYMQGILAKMKQKSWWEENYPEPQYALDYRTALYQHAFMWSFMILIPPILYYTIIGCGTKFYIACVILFILNTFIHAAIDDAKANKKTINLTTDQDLHTVQIMISSIVLTIAAHI